MVPSPLDSSRRAVAQLAATMNTADMMRHAADLMVSRGLRVQYADGWEARGRPYSFNPTTGVIGHHTASATDCDSVLINGRSDLPGPLCNWAVHADGTWVLIASGYANHAGSSVAGAPGNSDGWGVEATGPKQSGATGPSAFDNYAEYQAGMACILETQSWATSKIWGHKESCDPPGRKIDPSFDMDNFRSGVASGGDDLPPYSQWSTADRKKLCEDIIKAVTRGEFPDGSKPDHIVAASTGKIRDMQDLFGWGDGQNVPQAEDTHGNINVKSAINLIRDLTSRLEADHVITPKP
jgi:hypothetical protein